MPTLKEIERVFECEVNLAVNPPFITGLPAGGTVSLCSIVVPARRAGYLVRAVVNWSATFASAVAITATGTAQVTFQILRDGGPIAQVTQSIDSGIGVLVSTGFDIAAIQVLDTQSIFGVTNPLSTFEIRATNIILTPPLAVTTPGTVVAAAGLVSLVVEEIEACRAEALTV